MKKLFIDDERFPQDVTWAPWNGSWTDGAVYRNDDWTVVRNYDQAVAYVLEHGIPNLVSFDHDLGKDQKTGYDIAKKFCELIMDGMDIPSDFLFLIHSKNPVGAENIRVYMKNFLENGLNMNTNISSTLILFATEFRLSEDVTISKRGSGAYAVVVHGTTVLDKDGNRHREPMPPNRTDEFILDTRFTLEEAYAIATKYMKDQTP